LYELPLLPPVARQEVCVKEILSSGYLALAGKVVRPCVKLQPNSKIQIEKGKKGKNNLSTMEGHNS
jgi:hypothetical protein